MKISHEVPIDILEGSRSFNDYDYALVNILAENQDYFDFYKKSLEMGREVILDNSLFELGKAFDGDEYEYWVKRLEPTYYVIPDVFNDAYGSIKLAEQWTRRIAKRISFTMAVCHGRTYEEIEMCYRMYANFGINKIAFNYLDDVYKSHFKSANEVLSIMCSRVGILHKLRDNGVLNTNIQHHLLGCSSPDEFSFYKDFKNEYSKQWINTVDTSHPVVCGLENIWYSNYGNIVKPKTKIIDYMNRNTTVGQCQMIDFNVRKFRQMVGEE